MINRTIIQILFLTTLTISGPLLASHKSNNETAGDITQIALPLAAVTASLYHYDKPGLIEFAYAGLTTMAAVEILKYSVNRKRPNGHDRSFPSGHTAAAFVGAGYLQMRYGWAYGIPAYLLAGFTGYSRVESKNHWTSDVIAGAAIGIGANLLFTHPYQDKIKIIPYIDPKSKESGITFNYAE